MTKQELKEVFKQLEEQGWEPQLCDTPVPSFESSVMCGNPNDVGDLVQEEMMMPRSFLTIQQEFFIKARGDSMTGVDIMENDKVWIETEVPIHDGDIVLVMIDGEFTLKTYCEDDDGTPWLVPQNPKYKAFPLEKGCSVWMVGKATKILRDTPHTKYSTCKKLINEAKAEMQETRDNEPDKPTTEGRNPMELRIKYALDVLREEKLLKHLYDYTWVMEVMNKTRGLPKFYTPGSFITYLKELGEERLPSEDSIQLKLSKFSGDFPLWEFIDCDTPEANRRINVGKRFLTAFRSE